MEGGLEVIVQQQCEEKIVTEDMLSVSSVKGTRENRYVSTIYESVLCIL